MSLKTTIFNLIESAEALRYIAGVDDATKRSRYSFKPKAKLLLSKRLRTVTGMLDEIEEHRKQLLTEHKLPGKNGPDGKPEDMSEHIAAFNKTWQKYGKEEVVVECAMLEPELFDLDTNDIPASYLASLDWLINLDALDAPVETPKTKAAAAR